MHTSLQAGVISSSNKLNF